MTSDRIRTHGVFFVTRKWPPAVGGMETYSVELTRELATRLPVETIALPGRADGSPPRVFSLVAFAASAAWRYLKMRRSPAVLHIGDMACWPLALLAWTSEPRPQIVLSAHGTDVSFPRRKTLKGSLYGFYLRLGARMLPGAKVIANSSATAAVAGETGWRPAAVIRLATRSRPAGVPQGHDGHLLFAGRLIEQKGCLWFVRNVLPKLPPRIGLKVAGTSWDEAENAALDDPRVTFLGRLSGAELHEAYRRALCVVLPNIELPSGVFEGFGLVAPEASASGGLVLAAATGGLMDAVVDGETGFLLPVGDPDAWAAKIQEVASWAGVEREQFLERAIRRSSQVYSWSRVVEDVLDVYSDAGRKQ